MEAKIDKICCTQDKMVNFFESLLGKYGENGKTSVGVAEVMLPCRTLEDFMLIEKKLKKSETSKKKFVSITKIFQQKLGKKKMATRFLNFCFRGKFF